MNITFTWENRGSAIELVFRPRFHQKHRNLAKFEPWTYRIWKGPGTGYCTWRTEPNALMPVFGLSAPVLRRAGRSPRLDVQPRQPWPPSIPMAETVREKADCFVQKTR